MDLVIIFIVGCKIVLHTNVSMFINICGITLSFCFAFQTKDFWREAQILSKLHHPNVVAFYGVVPDGAGGTLATVTEFMVNGSLKHVLLRKDRYVLAPIFPQNFLVHYY